MLDDVITWKHFPPYWPFLRGIHRWSVNSPNKGQWCGALMFSLICAWRNGWVNNREAGDLRRQRAHHDVIVMTYHFVLHIQFGTDMIAKQSLLHFWGLFMKRYWCYLHLLHHYYISTTANICYVTWLKPHFLIFCWGELAYMYGMKYSNYVSLIWYSTASKIFICLWGLDLDNFNIPPPPPPPPPKKKKKKRRKKGSVGAIYCTSLGRIFIVTSRQTMT